MDRPSCSGHGRRRRRSARGEAGSSLLETLVASAVMLIVAVGIFPIFHRATANNLSGADSSMVSQFVRSRAEDSLALSIDAQRFNMDAGDPTNPLPPGATVSANDPATDGFTTGDKMVLPSVYWDPEINATRDTGDPVDALLTHHVATGAWVTIADPAAADGFWERRATIRQYTYADISEGVIDVDDPTRLTTLGHALLFDSPLPATAAAADRNFKEETIEIRSPRAGVPGITMRFLRAY